MSLDSWLKLLVLTLFWVGSFGTLIVYSIGDWRSAFTKRLYLLLAACFCASTLVATWLVWPSWNSGLSLLVATAAAAAMWSAYLERVHPYTRANGLRLPG